jgi:hypothetical protein
MLSRKLAGAGDHINTHRTNGMELTGKAKMYWGRVLIY